MHLSTSQYQQQRIHEKTNCHPETSTTQKETFGFNSTRTPPKIEEMKQFEDDLLNTIGNIEFKKVKCQFLSQLKQDAKTIYSSDNIYVPADKTGYYKV